MIIYLTGCIVPSNSSEFSSFESSTIASNGVGFIVDDDF
jgi:hypothetical protein